MCFERSFFESGRGVDKPRLFYIGCVHASPPALFLRTLHASMGLPILRTSWDRCSLRSISPPRALSGGGGGSYNAGSNQSAGAGFNTGHGYVTIDKL